MSALPVAATPVVADPFFLDAPAGSLFAVHHRPADRAALRGNVLCVPPFNEEMNRSRSMITLQAAAFARLGLGTLVVDLFGTGDSQGGHGDARWSIWLDDLRAAMAWLAQQPGGCTALLGTRLGAILAAQLHAERGGASTPLILWQPVVDGKLHFTQFLRVKMAAQLDRPDLPKETTGSMRKQLEAGEPLEVAGYEIHPELAAAIDGARLTDHAIASGTPVLWLENCPADNPELSVPSRKAIEAWNGAAIEAQTYVGPAFWQVHERVVTPSIIEQATSWMQAKAAQR